MELVNKINNKSAKVGVIGLGYVGLPLSMEFALKGFSTTGFDVDEKKIESIKKGRSYIKHIDEEKIGRAIQGNKLDVTTDFSRLTESDAIIIWVPTPLNEHREPDMSYVESTARTISKYLRLTNMFKTMSLISRPSTSRTLHTPMPPPKAIKYAPSRLPTTTLVI